MNSKNDRRAQVRFSASKFRLLPMDEKLAYLRAAFEALHNGKSVAEVTKKGARKLPRAGRPPSYIRLLWMAGFDRMTPVKKVEYLEYLARAYAELQNQMRAYFRNSAATALPISLAPTVLAPGAAKSAVRKPRARAERTARRTRSSPSSSSKL
ncbi:MAG TPA: hypothetical protein VL280_00285 [Burkholderiales bacterium]|jgi:hypothetical protein|nr:hypothetical protein [Burkholderiales bacterium]